MGRPEQCGQSRCPPSNHTTRLQTYPVVAELLLGILNFLQFLLSKLGWPSQDQPVDLKILLPFFFGLCLNLAIDLLFLYDSIKTFQRSVDSRIWA